MDYKTVIEQLQAVANAITSSNPTLQNQNVTQRNTVTPVTLPRAALPSAYGTRRSRSSGPSSGRGSACKAKIYIKDVVCLPKDNSDVFAIPRRVNRAELSEKGLIGKLMKPTFLTKLNPSPGTSSQNEGENSYSAYISILEQTPMNTQDKPNTEEENNIEESPNVARAKVSVRFADEEGIDVGGPSREFFRLLMKDINERSGIFQGEEYKRVLAINPEARRKDYYRLVGLAIVWSLVQGGTVGNFFSASLYNTIANVPELKLEDLPANMKSKVQKIQDASDINTLMNALDDEEITCILEAQGEPTFVNDIGKKDKFAKIIIRHVLLQGSCRNFL
ncbi:G2/M phase-specific E3 ubiquitin-protein ligase [Exaiptasia diaphana]|nr:G2/M phase-specific E3 ubiquitin-protein ligase [Exaiptasia diaphana]